MALWLRSVIEKTPVNPQKDVVVHWTGRKRGAAAAALRVNIHSLAFVLHAGGSLGGRPPCSRLECECSGSSGSSTHGSATKLLFPAATEETLESSNVTAHRPQERGSRARRHFQYLTLQWKHSVGSDSRRHHIPGNL